MTKDYKNLKASDNISIKMLLDNLKSSQQIQLEVSDKIIKGFTAYEVKKLLELNERYLYEFQEAHVVYVEVYNGLMRIIGEIDNE